MEDGIAWHGGWDETLTLTLTVPWYVLTAVGRGGGGQKGAASTVRANKCLVVKMSHMAFCMWRPLSFGRSPSSCTAIRTDSEMCVPRPNDARNEGRWRGEREREREGLGGPFYVKHAPKSYEFYYK